MNCIRQIDDNLFKHGNHNNVQGNWVGESPSGEWRAQSLRHEVIFRSVSLNCFCLSEAFEWNELQT